MMIVAVARSDSAREEQQEQRDGGQEIETETEKRDEDGE